MFNFSLNFWYSSSLPSGSGRYFSRYAISLPPNIIRASFLSGGVFILKYLNSLSISSSHSFQSLSALCKSLSLNCSIGKCLVSGMNVSFISKPYLVIMQCKKSVFNRQISLFLVLLISLCASFLRLSYFCYSIYFFSSLYSAWWSSFSHQPFLLLFYIFWAPVNPRRQWNDSSFVFYMFNGHE